MRDGVLNAQPFDDRRLAPAGDAVPVAAPRRVTFEELCVFRLKLEDLLNYYERAA